MRNRVYDPKPVFSVNPTFVITMNDEMAKQIVDFLNDVTEERKTIPPAIYAFKQTLIKDMEANP